MKKILIEFTILMAMGTSVSAGSCLAQCSKDYKECVNEDPTGVYGCTIEEKSCKKACKK